MGILCGEDSGRGKGVLSLMITEGMAVGGHAVGVVCKGDGGRRDRGVAVVVCREHGSSREGVPWALFHSLQKGKWQQEEGSMGVVCPGDSGSRDGCCCCCQT